MTEDNQSSKIVLQSSKRADNVQLILGGFMMIILSLTAFFYWRSLGAGILFLVVGTISFVMLSTQRKYKYPYLIIENGFLLKDIDTKGGGFDILSKIQIKDIQEIWIAYDKNPIASFNFLLIDSYRKTFRFDIFDLKKEDLVVLGEALATSSKIGNTKEVRGLLKGEIVESFIGLPTYKFRRLLFKIFYVVIFVGILSLIYINI